jgi:hypothetical protein
MKLRNFKVRSKFFVNVLLIIVLFTISVTAQSQKQLQLTTEIIEQSFCSIGEKTSLQLKLRLRYTNLGQERLIVYKGHDLFFQTRIRREENPAEEVLLLNMRYFDEEPERIDARSPGRVFAKLAPGASLDRELLDGIGVADNAPSGSATTVTPGRYTLQLIVSTWYQSPKLAEKLKAQWQHEGFLWSQPLYSIPVKLVISKPRASPPCQ